MLERLLSSPLDPWAGLAARKRIEQAAQSSSIVDDGLHSPREHEEKKLREKIRQARLDKAACEKEEDQLRRESQVAKIEEIRSRLRMCGIMPRGQYPSIPEIQALVALDYGISRTDIFSARQDRKVARPRQVGYYLSKKLTLKSLPQIGQAFGGRDHTTVLHGARKIERLRATDAELNSRLARYETELARSDGELVPRFQSGVEK